MIWLIEFVLEGKIDTLFHVREDDERAHGRREIVVRIALEVHVLGEIFRLHQLADVVKIGADAAKRRVRADAFGGGFGQIRDDEAVMIRAGRFDRHSAQQRMIEIGRFQPGNVGRDLEQMFEEWQRAADQHGGHNSIADRASALQADHAPIVGHRRKQIDRPDQAEGEREQPDGEADAKTGANELAAPAHLQGEIDSGKSADQTADQKRRIDFAEQGCCSKG